MPLLTIAASKALKGEISLPGDKSISHRAALFAALADGASRIENFLDAGVTRRMLSALDALGVAWSLEDGVLTVEGRGLKGLAAPGRAIDCGNSATTMRLLAGAVTAAGIAATLDGSDGLRSRPMNRIILPLAQMGAQITSNEGRAPLVFSARKIGRLSGERFELNVASAQVKSCLLLAALGAGGPVTIFEPGPSRDHSERMLTGMGANVEQRILQEFGGPAAFETVLHPTDSLRPIRMRLPGDMSSAAFLITAALITPGSEIRILDVGLNDTRTGLIDAYLAMGAQIDVILKGTQNGEPYGDLVVAHSRLHGIEVKGPLVVRMIDEFPVFAIAAALAEGPTVVSDAAELRLKESDRIRSITEQLRAIGIAIEEQPDGFRLPGSAMPTGGFVNSKDDHRIAMALACAGLVSSGPVLIENPEIIHESFPEFVPTLDRLGAKID